jgi:DNA-binding CsgD family transcriptional regulator
MHNRIVNRTYVPAELGVSAREAEVLAGIEDHLTNAEIAARLFISMRTVESHVSSLLRKFQVADRRALVAIGQTLRGPWQQLLAGTRRQWRPQGFPPS